jgi:hypothetical protein
MSKNNEIKTNKNKTQDEINLIFSRVDIDTFLKNKKKKKDRILVYTIFLAFLILFLGILFSI